MSRKAVIFDMGGVLVDLDMQACRDAFKRLLSYDRIDDLLDPCHQKGIIGDLEEGLINSDEFRSAVLSESTSGSLPETVDKAMWHILKKIDPYKAELLHKMAENYDLYMLSNNNGITMIRAYELFKESGIAIDETFIKCYLSYEMKALKPSAAFYKDVINDIGLPAEMLLFVDDSVPNVEGAVAAGLPAVHYVPGSDLSALLAEALNDPELRMEGVN